MYEYTSAVFTVGLDGFAPSDEDRITEMAAEGWEPAHMTPVHNGFAAVVLFRRSSDGSAPAGRARVAASRTRRNPPKAAVPPAPAAPPGRRAAGVRATAPDAPVSRGRAGRAAAPRAGAAGRRSTSR